MGGEAKGAGKKIGAGFGKVFAVAAGAVAAVGVADFLGGAIADARESAKITALTENVIKTTGGAAKVTAAQVQDLAGSIAAKTGIDDAAIQSASNLLLTFTNLRNEVGKGNDIFNQATKIATDMGAALGTEPKAAAIQLGKALNDPIKGVGALSRVGVSFTEQQKKVIKSLTDTGDIAGAQKVILKELGKEFGGSAEAQATAADKAAFAFGELKESIGTALIPVVDKLLNKIILPGINAVSDAFNKGGLKGVGKLIGDRIEAAIPVIKAKLAEFAPVFWEWVKDVTPPILRFLGRVLFAIGKWIATVAAPFLARKIEEWAKAFIEWIVPLIPPAIEELGIFAGKVFDWIVDTGLPLLVKKIAEWGKAFIKWVGPLIGPLLIALGKLVGKLIKWVVTKGYPKIAKAVAKWGLALVRWIAPQVVPATNALSKFTGRVAQWIVTKGAPRLVVATTKLGFALVRWIIPQSARATGALSVYTGRLARWIVTKGLPTLVAACFKMGNAGFGALLKAAARVTVQLTKFTASIPGRIVAAVGDLGHLLYDAGAELVQGLIDGITSKISALQSKMSELGGKIKGFLPGSPVKEGPLKEWNHGNGVSGAGRKLMDGVAEGIDARKKNVIASIKKVVSAFKAEFDNLKSASRELSSTIADAFRPDLLSGNLADFFTAGQEAKGNLGAVIAAFKKLKKFGLSAGFLSDLYASGNTGLILELAADKNTAKSAQSLFNQTNSLANSLGNKIAGNEYAPQFDNLGNRFEKAIERLGNRGDKQTKRLAHDLAEAINGAAVRGRRNARAA